MKNINLKILLWMAFILLVLFVGLHTEMSHHFKYMLVAAIFLVGVGLFIAIRKKPN